MNGLKALEYEKEAAELILSWYNTALKNPSNKPLTPVSKQKTVCEVKT